MVLGPMTSGAVIQAVVISHLPTDPFVLLNKQLTRAPLAFFRRGTGMK
jgi:hypothetical protein